MEYSYLKWDVEQIQDPVRLMEVLKSLDIKNKKIKNVKIVGCAYNLEETLDVYKEFHADKELFVRYVELGEPFIIEFEDGTTFEIDYSEGSTLKLGINSLPKDLVSPVAPNNVDGNIMFSNIIGEEIIGYTVDMTDEFELGWDFTGSYGIELDENQPAYISRIKIHLTNQLTINFINYYDYGAVFVNDANHHMTKIKWEELKKGIKTK